MVRHACAAAVIVLLLTCASSSSPAARQAPGYLLAASSDANDWLADVAAHVPGVKDEPLERIAAWPEKRLLVMLADVRGIPWTDAMNAALKRGAMLHADISLLLGRNGETPAVPSGWTSGGTSTLARDGQTLGTGALDPQIFFARRLLAATRPPLPPRGSRPDPSYERQRVREWYEQRARDPHIRQWYRAIAADFALRHWLADLVPHLEAAREMLPGDPGVLFDSGCLAETLASPRSQSALPKRPDSAARYDSRKLSMELERTRLSPTRLRADAEAHYRKALEADPQMTEARIRLARVLTERGRAGQALELLEPPVLAGDPATQYYAALVTGGAMERSGRPGDAMDAYRRAADLFPHAQTPHLALSRLARERGDAIAARAHMERVAALPPDEDGRFDPWWIYDLCNGRDATQEIESLRRMFTRTNHP